MTATSVPTNAATPRRSNKRPTFDTAALEAKLTAGTINAVTFNQEAENIVIDALNSDARFVLYYGRHKSLTQLYPIRRAMARWCRDNGIKCQDCRSKGWGCECWMVSIHKALANHVLTGDGPVMNLSVEYNERGSLAYCNDCHAIEHRKGEYDYRCPVTAENPPTKPMLNMRALIFLLVFGFSTLITNACQLDSNQSACVNGKTTIPYTVGEDAGTAQTNVNHAGLTYEMDTAADFQKNTGKVVSTYPTDGTVVPCGSNVIIYADGIVHE